MDTLTNDDTAILDFERNWYRHRGHKEDAILATFGVSATTHYSRLNALLDREDALAADPLLVRRLRRLRSARQRQRSAERLREDGVRR